MNDSEALSQSRIHRLGLDDAVAELATTAVGEGPPEPALLRVAELAKKSLPEAQEVSITLVENGRPRTVVFTGDLAVDLDERQYELGFGPCVDAARSGQLVIVDAADESSPYRPFARLAARAAVRQTLALGMPVSGHSIGALNVYRTVEGPVGDELLEQLETFVGYAAVTVNNVACYDRATRASTDLRAAMDSRAVIEQAKGIIMGREHCSPDDAFALLTRMSQHTHTKLREVAARVVASAQA
jgi:GAF domain-containing protein